MAIELIEAGDADTQPDPPSEIIRKINKNFLEVSTGSSPPAPTQVGVDRVLTNSDNQKTLECTVDDLDITVPSGLATGFACTIIPKGTTSVVSSGGALLNGATSTLARDDADNAMFAIVGLGSAADSYKVSGL